MRSFVVFFGLVAVALASPVQPESRIIGGIAAAGSQFPHKASVRTFENAHLCGGFINTVKWIISSASCTSQRTIANTMVVVGTNSLTEGGYEYELSRIIPHPQFSAAALNHNIALLEILYEIDLYPSVLPFPIATDTPVTARRTGIVAGWGANETDGAFTEDLQWISVITLPNAECRDRFGVVEREYIVDSKICIDNVEGVGMCTGDSGNALVSGNQVIGIASWGFGGCGSGFPNVFTRLSYYAAWINGIINSV